MFKYNSKVGEGEHIGRESLDVERRGGSLIEALGRYGDPTIIEMLPSLQADLTCDMSFTGI